MRTRRGGATTRSVRQTVLVAAIRRPVEQLVGADQRLAAARVGRVRVVDGAAVHGEGAQARQLLVRGVDRAEVVLLGRGAASALRVHELAGRRIVLAARGTAEQLGLSVPTVNAALARLEEAGILREATGRRRGRAFVYAALLDLLQAE